MLDSEGLLQQSHDTSGRILCVHCDKVIYMGEFYVVMRQLHVVDSDSKLAIHLKCILEFIETLGAKG